MDLEKENLKLVLKKNNVGRLNFKLKNIEIGKDFLMIAGPCSVDDEESLVKTALAVKIAGANMLRGGAYKPRTSPYAFQGLGLRGLQYLKTASEESGLPVVTEIVDIRDVDLIAQYADVFQVGSRNMHNYAMLKELGKVKIPVLLKRGMQSTILEWMNSAEYILKEGNPNVILCERGVRTVETYTRNVLDVTAIAALKKITHLPIIADPSHATGRRELIEPMSLSAIMAGADGLIIEASINPDRTLCDSNQTISTDSYKNIAQKVQRLREFIENL